MFNFCESASFHLYNIQQIRRFLPQRAFERLMHAFISSMIDYSNALLYDLPQCLESIEFNALSIQPSALGWKCPVENPSHLCPPLCSSFQSSKGLGSRSRSSLTSASMAKNHAISASWLSAMSHPGDCAPKALACYAFHGRRIVINGRSFGAPAPVIGTHCHHGFKKLQVPLFWLIMVLFTQSY